MRDRIELTAEEAWAVYVQLDDYLRLYLLPEQLLAAAAEVDQICTDLWRKLNEEA